MIVNQANGKYYIGKTVRNALNAYLNMQITNAFNPSGKTKKPHLYNAIRKYGADKFRIHSLMSTLPNDDAICQQEEFLINLFKARDPKVGYNITGGGRGRRGKKSPEEIEKIRLKNAGRKHTAQARKNMSDAHKGQTPWITGKRHNSETRLKMSRAACQRPLPEALIANQTVGRIHSHETKQRMSVSQKASWTPERRAAHAEQMRARHRAKKVERECH